MFVLITSSGTADWIRLNSKLNIFILREVPLSILGLSALKMFERACNIIINWMSFSVIFWFWISLLWMSWIVPFMVEFSFGPTERITNVANIMIISEVWNWVINWISKLGFFVLVLITACRGANWIRLKINISVKLEKPIFVIIIISWNSPDTILILFWTPFGSKSFLLILDVFLGCQDIVINTKVWNKIIHWGTLWSLERGLHHVL